MCVDLCCLCVLLPLVASPLSFILARIGERSALRTSSSVLFGTRFPFCAARGDLAVAVAFLRGGPRAPGAAGFFPIPYQSLEGSDSGGRLAAEQLIGRGVRQEPQGDVAIHACR